MHTKDGVARSRRRLKQLSAHGYKRYREAYKERLGTRHAGLSNIRILPHKFQIFCVYVCEK